MRDGAPARPHLQGMHPELMMEPAMHIYAVGAQELCDELHGSFRDAPAEAERRLAACILARDPEGAVLWLDVWAMLTS